ncbi:MAG: hypothetical protein IJX47_05245 [Clostridia bacterium]|nr:hypothetical protein [Clostridia bacterium]
MRSILLKAGALALCALLAGGTLTACGSSDGSEPAAQTTVDYMHDYEKSGDVSVSTGKTHTFLSAEVTDTVIVTGSQVKDTSPILTAVKDLRTYITTFTDITLETKGDFLLEGEDPSAVTEILIGETDREESALVAETLRINDYAIQVVNNKLVVLGGCEEKTAEAVYKLIELYFSAARTDLVLECGYRYQYRYDYDLSDLTLNGKSVLDYTIVYGSDFEGVATYLQTALADAMGYEIPVAKASSAGETAELEILVGVSDRETSVTAAAGAYQVGMDGNKLVFAGDDSTVLLGVRAFTEQYITGGSDVSKVEASLSLTGAPTYDNALKLLSLNVTQSGYGENAVVNRYPRLYSLIAEQAPDVLCLQEVSCTTWLSCINEGIGDTPALTDTYQFVGTGRNGEAPKGYEAFLEGAYNAILFNKTKYKLEDSGTFWLSETPETASVGWDGRTFSICTWAKLTEISSGEQFVVMNTQLDTYGRSAAGNGASLICEKAAEFGLPVILAGDFGVGSSGKPYKNVVGDNFADTLKVAETVVSSGATQNGYGTAEVTTATSHVFVTRGLCGVKSYELLTDLIDGGYVSSHWAIVTEIKY